MLVRSYLNKPDKMQVCLRYNETSYSLNSVQCYLPTKFKEHIKQQFMFNFYILLLT